MCLYNCFSKWFLRVPIFCRAEFFAFKQGRNYIQTTCEFKSICRVNFYKIYCNFYIFLIIFFPQKKNKKIKNEILRKTYNITLETNDKKTMKIYSYNRFYKWFFKVPIFRRAEFCAFKQGMNYIQITCEFKRIYRVNFTKHFGFVLKF